VHPEPGALVAARSRVPKGGRQVSCDGLMPTVRVQEDTSEDWMPTSAAEEYETIDAIVAGDEG